MDSPVQPNRVLHGDDFPETFRHLRGALEENLRLEVSGDKVIEDTALTAQNRHELISEVVLDICGFCDDNSLYLNEEITFQCAALFMGVEDIQAESDAAKRKGMVSDFSEMYKQALDIIRAEAGLRRMNKLFQTVTNAKYSSDLIEHFREAQKEHRRRSRR